MIRPTGERDEALRLIKRDGFDVAVVDINLRDQMAYPLADELERQGIPFAFATGYSNDVSPEKYAHVIRWQKPYELGVIVVELSKLCGKLKPSATKLRA